MYAWVIWPLVSCRKKHWTGPSSLDLGERDQNNLLPAPYYPRTCRETAVQSGTQETITRTYSTSRLGVFPECYWNTLWSGFTFTLSMTPAPRQFMALSFLSGSGGLNWMMFFCRRAKGVVTNTYNTAHNKKLFSHSVRGRGSCVDDLVWIGSLPSEQ